MINKKLKNGSVLLMTVLVITLLSILVVGILQINTEEIQIVRNQMYAANAIAIAEAGLNDAFSFLRDNSGWRDGFSSKSFNGGSYTVNVTGTLPNLNIVSVGTSAQSFVARLRAEVTLSAAAPYIIRIDKLRINE